MTVSTDDFENFKLLFNSLADESISHYPDLKIDREKEFERYRAFAERIRPLVVESVSYLNKKAKKGAKILVEGANAGMIDIDFGIYPYVTSSNCSIGGVCTGLGLPPQVRIWNQDEGLMFDAHFEFLRRSRMFMV